MAWRGELVLDPAVIKARLKGVVEVPREPAGLLDRRATIPFAARPSGVLMAGLIADAPVYSPFVRRKQHLDLGRAGYAWSCPDGVCLRDVAPQWSRLPAYMPHSANIASASAMAVGQASVAP